MPKQLPDLNQQILIFDGAMGTMLHKSGYLGPGQPPELLNLSHPETVAEVHKAYIEAGSNMIQTNTFGGNRIKLDTDGLGDKVREINFAAVQLAKKVAGDRVFVAGDISSTGKMMEPLGELTFTETLENFSEQSRILAEAGVDLINIETMSDILETKAAIIAALSTGLPVSATVSFMENGRTLTGLTPEMVSAILSGFPLYALGTNCGMSAASLYQIVEKLATYSQRPLLIKPNAGKPEVKGTETIYQETPYEFAQAGLKLVQLGARIIGGCCGTSPEHIRSLSAALVGHQISLPTYTNIDYLVGKNNTMPVAEALNITEQTELHLNDQTSIWQQLSAGSSEELIDQIFSLDTEKIQLITVNALDLTEPAAPLLAEIAKTFAMYWPNTLQFKLKTAQNAKAILAVYPGRILISGAPDNIELVKAVSDYGGIFQALK